MDYVDSAECIGIACNVSMNELLVWEMNIHLSHSVLLSWPMSMSFSFLSRPSQFCLCKVINFFSSFLFNNQEHHCVCL